MFYKLIYRLHPSEKNLINTTIAMSKNGNTKMIRLALEIRTSTISGKRKTFFPFPFIGEERKEFSSEFFIACECRVWGKCGIRLKLKIDVVQQVPMSTAPRTKWMEYNGAVVAKVGQGGCFRIVLLHTMVHHCLGLNLSARPCLKEVAGDPTGQRTERIQT